MDYALFESRALEVFYKAESTLTPQLAAYRVGCTVAESRTHLEAMAAQGTVLMDVDEDGNISYRLPGGAFRAPSGEPLSFSAQAPASSGNVLTPALVRAPYGIQPYGTVPMVYLAQEKSVGLSVLLAFLFGPFGMFYSTVPGAVAMLIFSFFVILGTLGLGAFLIVPMCMLWAGAAANAHNHELRRQLERAAPRMMLRG